MGSPRPRIRLVHWKREEVPERVARLEAAGYAVDGEVPGTSIGIKQLREDPPDAFVIDLGRLPSHGREVARALRQSKSLRWLPIVFVAGEATKVAAARGEFPDAPFVAAWEDAPGALAAAIADPPDDPVVPKSDSGPESSRPLVAKLGVKTGTRLVLIEAPDGFEALLAPLPEGVAVRRGNRGGREMTIWFTTSRRELSRRFAKIAAAVGEGTLWMAWPKGSSGVETDLGDGVIRDTALAAGMVDSKICAIDTTWSGMRLTRRRSP